MAASSPSPSSSSSSSSSGVHEAPLAMRVPLVGTSTPALECSAAVPAAGLASGSVAVDAAPAEVELIILSSNSDDEVD